MAQTEAQMMAAYDELPPEVRRAFADAHYQLTTDGALRLVRRGYSAKHVAGMIRDEDEALVPELAEQFYGADHPQAGR